MRYAFRIAFSMLLCVGLASAQNTPIVSGAVTLQVLGGQRSFSILLNQNVTSFSINAPSASDGMTIVVTFTQDATGGRTVSGYASNIQNTGVVTISSGAGSVSVASMIYSSLGNTWAVIGGSGGGGTPTLDAVLNPVANKDFNLGTNTLSFTSSGTSNGVNLDASGNLYPIGTGSVGANKARFGATPIIFNPSIVPTTGQCLDYDGTYISGTTCGSGGTPGGSTTQYQINNAGAFAGAAALTNSSATGVGTVIISQAGTGGTDIPAERILGFPTSPTADKWQVAATGQTPGPGCTVITCVAWISASGSWNLNASNFQLSTTGAAPYLYLNGSQGTPAQPYLKLADAALPITTCSASTATTGGTLAAATYWFECTYTNSAGETSFQTAFSIATTGTTSTITIAAPGINVSASGYHVYYGGTGATQPAQTSFDLVTTLTGVCTAGTTDLNGHVTCAPASNAVFTAAPTTSAINPPTTNTTGAAFIDAWQASGEGVGLCLASSTSASDCVVGGGVELPGGTGLNLTSGATTTANTLACFSASETASQCAANAANDIVGVFIGGQQNSLVQTTGIATINLAAAATTTYNHFACTNATAGTIVDSASACASGQQVGLIAQTNASNVTSVPVFLETSGGGSSGGTVTYTASQTASGADNGELVIMNCSAACTYTLPNPQPSSKFSVTLKSLGTTIASVTVASGMTLDSVAEASAMPLPAEGNAVTLAANSSTSTDYQIKRGTEYSNYGTRLQGDVDITVASTPTLIMSTNGSLIMPWMSPNSTGGATGADMCATFSVELNYTGATAGSIAIYTALWGNNSTSPTSVLTFPIPASMGTQTFTVSGVCAFKQGQAPGTQEYASVYAATSLTGVVAKDKDTTVTTAFASWLNGTIN